MKKTHKRKKIIEEYVRGDKTHPILSSAEEQVGANNLKPRPGKKDLREQKPSTATIFVAPYSCN